MINLYQSKITKCAFFLEGNITNNKTYLFEFYNVNSNVVTYFLSTDISLFPSSYNSFLISITGSSFVNLSASTVYLTSDQYNYRVYSADTLSQSANTSELAVLEYGKANVFGTPEQNEYFTGLTLIKKYYVSE